MDIRKVIQKGVRFLILIALSVLLFYVCFATYLYFAQAHLVFAASKEVDAYPSDIGLEYEDLDIVVGKSGHVNAWFIPREGASKTVLFCHGNAGNISSRLDTIRIFHDIGLNAIIFDYRGYGKSSPNATEEGTYQDARSVYNYLIEKKKILPENIILMGRSLGGPIAAHLASEVDSCGLIIESSFTSLADMAEHLYPYMPVRFFARIKYDTANYLKMVHVPVLIIHSSEDDFVPYKFGQQLFSIANEPKSFVEISGGHNNGFVESEPDYSRALKSWLESLSRAY